MNDRGAIFCLFYLDGFNLPDVVGIFSDGPVGGEDSRTGHIDDCHFIPEILVSVGTENLFVGLHIGIEIGKDVVGIRAASINPMN